MVGSVSDTVALQNAFDQVPAGSILDLGDATDHFSTTAMITRTTGSIELRGEASITYVGAGEIEAVIKVNDCSDVSISGPVVLDGGGNARHCLLVQSSTVAIQNVQIDRVSVKNSKVDPNLWYGGITVYASEGQASTHRPKNIKITNTVSQNCGTHGELVAYCDNVTFSGNYIKSCRNHGFEAVNCSNVSITGNNVDSAGISALGVGTNVVGFEIADNQVINCGGDGSITVEHNSVNGSVHHNVIANCNSSGINVSFGSPAAFPCDTVRNVSVHHNVVSQKVGVSGYAGCNYYASPTAKGYGVNIDDNSFVGFDRGVDYAYGDHGSCSKNLVMMPSGSPVFITRGIFVKDVVFSGNVTPNTTSDHAFQIWSNAGNQSSFCRIAGNYAQQCGPTSNMCLVYIDGNQLGFEVTGNGTSGAYSYLYCSGTPSVILSSNRGPLSYSPYVGVGVPIICSSNENYSQDFTRVGTAKEVAGTAIPATGTWQAGDRCRRVPAVIGQPKGWVCTTGGTPGTWVSEGTLFSAAP